MTTFHSTYKKYWYLFWHFRKLSLMKLIVYRTDFFFWLTVSMMWTFFNFFFFSLLIRLTDSLAGWQPWEMYALLSVFTMLDAFTWSVMYQNMRPYTADIFEGRLSFLLTKPVDIQFMVMTRETSYNNIPRFFVGLTALWWSLKKLHIEPSMYDIIMFTFAFVAGLLLVYIAWFTVATAAFWVEKLDNINEIVPGLRRIWQVPRQVYGGIISTVLTVLLPFGLVTSIPAEILVKQTPVVMIAYLLIFSLIFFGISRLFLQLSIRKYSSVGG